MGKHVALVQVDQIEGTPSGTPTQLANPGRAVGRTLIAYAGSAIVLLPTINYGLFVVQEELEKTGLAVPGWIWAALNLAIVLGGFLSAVVTRLLAYPRVHEWVKRHLPALAPIPVKPEGD